jgi:hypothetical protein
MLPDYIFDEIKEQARLYFSDGNPKLMFAVEQLADHGWTWDAMRPVLVLIYNAGYEQAIDEERG